MSLLLALVGEEVVGKRFKHHSKGYVKRGHKVLVFNTQEQADQFEEEEAQALASAAITKAKRKPVVVKPAQVVNLNRVEKQVQAWSMDVDVRLIADAMDFDQLMRIQEKIAFLQDEEDVELLLF